MFVGGFLLWHIQKLIPAARGNNEREQKFFIKRGWDKLSKIRSGQRGAGLCRSAFIFVDPAVFLNADPDPYLQNLQCYRTF